VIKRRPAALQAVCPRHRRLELAPEQFEGDHGAQALKVVTLLRQTGQPLLDIEETTLTRHPRLLR